MALENLTTGAWTSAKTSANGFANLTVNTGYYDLFANASANTHISLTRTIFVHAGMLLQEYLLASTAAVTTVNNCGASQLTCTASVWATPTVTLGFTPSQFVVQLLNHSSSDAPLAVAVTAGNGTAGFTKVNTAFQYRTTVIGWNDSETGTFYWMSNNTGGAVSPSGVTVLNPGSINGASKYSSAITGSSGPTLFGQQWVITANTVVTGGVFVLSSQTAAGSQLTLTFVNCLVVFNTTIGDNANNIAFAFVNSTAVALQNPSSLFGNQVTIPGESFVHSVFYASLSTGLGSGLIFGATTWQWSALEDWTASNGHVVKGTYTNFVALNDQLLLGDASFQHVYNDRFSFTTLQLTQVTGFSQGTLSLTNSILVNATIPAAFSAAYSNQSYLNLTVVPGVNSYGLMGPNGKTGQFNQDQFSVYVQNFSNFGAFLHSFNSNGNPSLSLQLPKVDTINQSVVNMSGFPSVNETFSGSNVTVLNSLIQHNYSVPSMTAWLVNAPSAPRIGNGLINANNLFANYTTFTTPDLFWLNVNFNATLSHDSIPSLIYSEGQDFMSMFAGQLAKTTVDIENTTFGSAFLNWTAQQPIERYTSGNALWGLWDVNIANSVIAGPRYLVIRSDTFQARMLTPTTTGFLSADLEIAESHIYATVANSLFANNQAFDLGPSNNFAPPYAADILSEGASVNATSNWFLNLNNATVPIATVGGQNLGKSPPAIHLLGNNRFFVKPLFGGGFSPAGLLSTSQYNASQGTDPSSGAELGSTVAYEIPLFVNGTMMAPATSATLVSNSSNKQTTIAKGTGPDWAWGFAPDVNDSSGSLVLSYQNGLAAGPQPNFYFGGSPGHLYNYSEQVEPLQIEIGVNSSSAPSVSVSFGSLNVGSLYAYAEFNGTSGKQISPASNNYLYANSGGWINFTFSPSAGPLSEIFVLYPAGGGGFFSANTGGLFIDFLIILVGGMVLVGIPLVLALSERRDDGP